jgi:hypothetical protein
MAMEITPLEHTARTMRKVAVLAAILLAALAFWLFPRIWNPVENGPELENPSAFFGCYQNGPNKLSLSQGYITVTKTDESTRVKRFLYIKNDAAINTVNNLQYDAGGHSLRVGRAATGFFYRFDNPSQPSALLIPDDGGKVRRLARVSC